MGETLRKLPERTMAAPIVEIEESSQEEEPKSYLDRTAPSSNKEELGIEFRSTVWSTYSLHPRI